MRRNDLLLLGVMAALMLALLMPAGLSSWTALGNFGDVYSSHYPFRHAVVSALQSGRLPFWNPYIFSGLPLLADPQTVTFYPVSLLGAALPLMPALVWDQAFHWLWALAGLFLLARAHRMRALGAAFLAAAFALCPFVVYRIPAGDPTVLASLSWAPWCWLAWLCGGPALLGAVWALQFLSGHPQFMLVNAIGMSLWALANPRRGELFGRLLSAGLLTLALAAAQWLPFREFLAHSMRRGWPLAYTTAYSFDPAALRCLLSPGALGEVLSKTFAGPPSVFFEGTGFFLSRCGLALACWGLLRAGRRGPLVLLGAGVFLALGGRNPAYVAMLGGPLGWLRTPVRYLLLGLWGLLLAAGAGWRRLRWPAGLRLALVLAAVAELVLWDRRFLYREDSRPYLSAHPEVAAAAGGKPWRVLTDPALTSPDKTMLYRARNVNGYAAFYLEGYPRYAARSEGKPAADASRTYLSRADSPEMNRLGVRWSIAADGSLAESSGALPLVYFAGAQGKMIEGSAKISLPRSERWRVEGEVPAGAVRLVAAQPLYPGWRARLNGARVPVELWDGLLQSVRVSPGRFLLELDYRPTYWPLWALVSAVSWALWLCLRSAERS